ncbi:hypothetical protein UCRPC4_g05480 [Phaeomoniella chlamydospora]|uniref:AMP-activated protein kinase glycogen-binding domain-containing protein n=1 Tax=Phaeomoniella chlamydospora TaxID=158046 RepID=A0A0G2GKV5_PHACM|nr:hypothetical protein UCRPC4_g05480 [Phaeomoniella chlamydospora]
MGSFVFKWPHAASEVFVTGTFDDWGKTVQLEKVGDVFEKDVQLPSTDKVFYKFVVDGNWTTDSEAPTETDSSGNVNNVVTTENIKAPVESNTSPPGAFPETPATEAKEFSVKPIPASEGAGNPVKVAPGEEVPQSIGDVGANVTTSKEDYENATTTLPIAAGAAGVAGVAAGAAAEKEFSVPEKSSNIIPESSLPVESAGPTIQSAGAGTTTAELAGQQPLEPKREAFVEEEKGDVPEVVKESIAESKEAPEATTNPEAVAEKAATEEQLLKEIKPSEATGEPAPTATETPAVAAVEVPEAVKESIAESKQGPEAAANPEAVEEKAAVEAELLKDVKPSEAVGEPAPTATAATTETAPAPTEPEAAKPAEDAAAPSEPTVTTGVDTTTTETVSTPKKEDTPASSAASTPDGAKEDKKKKRRSFFQKLKEKLK